MVRRRHNPFASELRSLPHRALLRREEPFRGVDEDEVKMTCKRIAQGARWLGYAGSRGIENGCRVFAFDTPEKAQAMQALDCRVGSREPAASRAAAQLSAAQGGMNDNRWMEVAMDMPLRSPFKVPPGSR